MTAAKKADRPNKEIKRRGKRLLQSNFEEGDSYESEFEKPIKESDLILIEGDWNKNDLNPYFRVIATAEYPTGVDWYEGVVYRDVNSRAIFA